MHCSLFVPFRAWLERVKLRGREEKEKKMYKGKANKTKMKNGSLILASLGKQPESCSLAFIPRALFVAATSPAGGVRSGDLPSPT